MKKKLLLALLVLGAVVLFALSQKNENDTSTQVAQPDRNEQVPLDDMFSEDFEQKTIYSPLGWKTKQLQRGSYQRVVDPIDATNMVGRFRAGEKQSSQVGKADLIKKIHPAREGNTVKITFDVYIPQETPLDSIILADLECSTCGLDTNPGIRLYLRDGRLRLDPSKIGYQNSINQTIDVQLQHDRWYSIVWKSTISIYEDGINQVFLDEQLVIDAKHPNVISQRVVDQYEVVLQAEHVDTVQLGLTANSNTKTVEILMDNIEVERQ